MAAVAALTVPIPEAWGGAADTAILPPALPWDGKSQDLALAGDDPWVTPSEAAGFRTTPSYDETIAWLRRLVDASDRLGLQAIGQTDQGRQIWMVIASHDQATSARALADNGRPTLLAHGGIHAGEIDGKDAGLMLLRDLTVYSDERGMDDLLARVNLLFIPVLNVDGHERSSPYNRMNQRGPDQMGWRANARNLNLNRDYAKVDTPGIRALLRVINDWDPDLYFDLHVTDGADYLYDITLGWNSEGNWSPSIASWLDDILWPRVSDDLKAWGHAPGPLIFAANYRDFSLGMASWTASPRYSNGYGDARHLPTVLVENHSLKPYAQRVLGTRVLLESSLRCLAENSAALQDAAKADRERRPPELPLHWDVDPNPTRTIDLEVVRWETRLSEITGDTTVAWLGEVETMSVAVYSYNQPGDVTTRPAAYWVPPTWPEVIQRLDLHGVQMDRIDDWREVDVEMYRLTDPQLAATSFEGRVQVTATPVVEARQESYPPGSVRVPTDQPLGDLVVLLLEPNSPDSFFQWGFFHEVLQRTEYFATYVMEPMARAMLEANPQLKAEYEQKLRDDPKFAATTGRDRLEWFYERTPFIDDRWLLYPVGRER